MRSSLLRRSQRRLASSEAYQYQEMGPMRFPVSITMNNETIPIQDHRMVFQLADVLNAQNGNESDYMVNFIPWYQNTPNTPANTAKRRPDGTVPGRSEVEDNLAYATNANATYSNATAVAEAEEDAEQWIGLDTEKMRSFASNIFEAHKQAVVDGYFDYSEAGYLYYKLGWSKNITDQADGFTDDSPSWPYESVYFSATEWRTIDQGLSKLPEAFGPQVLNRTVFDTSVQGMVWNETSEKMSVQYRNKNLFDIEPDGEMEFDYVVSAVPFTRARIWHPMPDYSSLLSRAIQSMGYQPACKVALHFETRFWEHSEYPIYGGCGSSNIPGIGSICYPSYNINASGPGVILASYVSDSTVPSLSALSEEENVARVLRAMVETHGSVAKEQYTGAHDRICWANMENQAGAWCSPIVGQQDLYLPAYFHTEKHTVFVDRSSKSYYLLYVNSNTTAAQFLNVYELPTKTLKWRQESVKPTIARVSGLISTNIPPLYRSHWPKVLILCLQHKLNPAASTGVACGQNAQKNAHKPYATAIVFNGIPHDPRENLVFGRVYGSVNPTEPARARHLSSSLALMMPHHAPLQTCVRPRLILRCVDPNGHNICEKAKDVNGKNRSLPVRQYLCTVDAANIGYEHRGEGKKSALPGRKGVVLVVDQDHRLHKGSR
ncbi:L-amino acid oxidase-like protein LaoA [Hortaea werneckii]|nr:L-amino acid oxidase-like protein LaoA [Hortaea werneckii]